MSEFTGRRVIVTGAGRGLGRGIAEAFARAGARVMIGARTMSYADEALAAIRTEGVTPLSWASRTRLLNAMYNDIWAENWGSIPVSAAEGGMIARLTLPTSHLSWLRVAYHGEEPIALLTQIPDTNEALQGLGGRMLPFGWSRMLWRIHGRGTRMTRVPMFGLRKAWHRTRLGTLAANRLMAEAMLQAKDAGAAEMEISWILETNTVFLNMVAGLSARLTRTFRVYERPL